jgi:SAM-dependent methyltransferase
MNLEAEFGAIDIYLFDQILRGRITARDRVFDAGCGMGRNLVYLMRAGCDVCAVDADSDAIREVRSLAVRLAPRLSPENFRVEPIERTSFPDQHASVVISSAVLHFAADDAHFEAMLDGAWRVLAPGGLFFCRLASSIGMVSEVRRLGATGRRYRLPDGTDRYLVDEDLLMAHTRRLGGALLDPLKTTIVQAQRAMTTWVVRKNGPSLATRRT